MPGDSWKLAPGLNNVGSYEVSGKPFCSGNINATTACKIPFDTVTRWVMINNRSIIAGEELRVGFSEAGIRGDKAWTDANYASGENYFVLPAGIGATANSGSWALARLELKVSEIWLSGSAKVDVIAGLTNIPKQRTTTANGTSWSGSNGVG